MALKFFLKPLFPCALLVSIVGLPGLAGMAANTVAAAPSAFPPLPAAQPQLGSPQANKPLEVTGPHPSEQPGATSPILGQTPPVPLSLQMFHRLQQQPGLRQELQKNLNPVTSEPAAPSPGFKTSGSAAPAGGSWAQGPFAPGNPPLSNPLLLTDGSVIAHVSCTGDWYKLTPDYSGSYINGSWSQIASLPSGYTPRFFSSAVLPDGRVIVEGGEYNTGCFDAWTNLGAIYDPSTNVWTSVSPPSGWSSIGDAQSTVLANGVYMQANSVSSQQALFNPANLTWTATGAGKFDSNDEEGWTLLPDGSVLAVDAYVNSGTCGKNSERYSPSTGSWTSAGNTPSILSDCGAGQTYELGPQVLRPDGTMVVFGGTTCGFCAAGNTSVVTPTAIFTTVNATWSAGPNLPQVGGNNYTLADAPAALLPNGNVLFAASPNYNAFVTPTHFFEWNTNNTITQVAEPTDASSYTSFQWNFLVLPTGQVMALETDGPNVWIYTPSGSPNNTWKPAVTSTPPSLVAGGTFSLSGTQLNGLSQGAAYGDDAQAASNYPIVSIVNKASGHVAYGRSFNFSSMTVAPNAASTATFTLPENFEQGPSSLYVTANGITSAPVSLNLERSLYAKAPDFNGDGKTDILWRDQFGTGVVWELNGGQVLAAGGNWNVQENWRIVGTGDFNGDGKTDILWRYIDGSIAIWEMNGLQPIAGVGGWNVSNDWTILGTGDFNGDGTSDILWRYKDGTIIIWEMSNGQPVAGVGGWNVSNDWTIVGTGDFNGDGKSDILWRYKDGTGTVWEMNGGQSPTGTTGWVVTPDWTIVGTGDFNHDGTTDILWRYKDGTVVIWQMSNGQPVAGIGGWSVSLDWTIAGSGDFNGDGTTDILWRNTNGGVVIWEMNGGQITAGVGNWGVSPFQWTMVQ